MKKLKISRLIKLGFLIFLIFSFRLLAFSSDFDELGLGGRSSDGRFLVYASDYGLAKKISSRVRDIYNKVISDIGYSGAFKGKYQIFVWDSKSGFMNFLRPRSFGVNAENVAAVAIAKYSNGVATIAGYSSDRFFNSDLPHELTHLILNDIFGSAQLIPLWLNEGLATYEGDGPLGNEQRLFLREALSNQTHIPLAELFSLRQYPLSGYKIKLFYLQSQSLVDYLLRTKPKQDSFDSFLRWYVVKGNSFPKAYLYSYGAQGGLKKLEESWINYIMNN
ncbi:MAG: peptidase MA family metallohydrolase [Candidatus Omnitrophica bacterium]|nr:peptidase MA family metallohydrolase [Candidatus Omnitrophota bacterium]